MARIYLILNINERIKKHFLMAVASNKSHAFLATLVKNMTFKAT